MQKVFPPISAEKNQAISQKSLGQVLFLQSVSRMVLMAKLLERENKNSNSHLLAL